MRKAHNLFLFRPKRRALSAETWKRIARQTAYAFVRFCVSVRCRWKLLARYCLSVYHRREETRSCLHATLHVAIRSHSPSIQSSQTQLLLYNTERHVFTDLLARWVSSSTLQMTAFTYCQPFLFVVNLNVFQIRQSGLNRNETVATQTHR